MTRWRPALAISCLRSDDRAYIRHGAGPALGFRSSQQPSTLRRVFGQVDNRFGWSTRVGRDDRKPQAMDSIGTIPKCSLAGV